MIGGINLTTRFRKLTQKPSGTSPTNFEIYIYIYNILYIYIYIYINMEEDLSCESD